MTTIPITLFDPRKPFVSAGLLVRDAFVKLNDLIKRTGGERGEALGPLPDYTIATLPSASNNAKCFVYVTDGVGNKFIAISNGTSWYYADGTAV